MNLNSLLGFVARGIEAAIMLFLVLIIPKIVDVNEYVDFQLYWPAGVLGASIFIGWLSGSIYRHIHDFQKSKSEKSYLSALVLILSFTSFIMLAYAYLSASWLFLVFSIVITYGLKDLLKKIFISSEKYKKYLGFVILFFMLRLSVMFYVSAWELTAFELVFYFAVSDVLVFLILGYSVIFSTPKLFGSKSFFLKHLYYGLPLIVSTISNWILSISDRYILNFFREQSEVAGYILSYQLISNFLLIPLSILITIYYPMLLRVEKDSGLDRSLSINKFYLKFYYIGMLLFLVVGVYFVDWLIGFYYQNYFVEQKIIWLIGLGCYIFGITHFANKPLELTGRTSDIAKAVLLGAVVNIILNILIVPIYGAVGAACTTLISYIIIVLFVWRVASDIQVSKPVDLK